MSSLCRGGFFPADAAERRDEDNRRAVEEAAALGTRRARARLRAAAGRATSGARARRIDAGIERAARRTPNEHGVRLGIEPLHPMMIGERSAIVTLGEALDIAERIGDPGVGVVVDVYHELWDPRAGASRSRGRRGGSSATTSTTGSCRRPDTLLGAA